MDADLATFRGLRAALARFADGLDPQRVDLVPPGFKNSLHWNLAHVVVTQKLLCYGLAELPLGLEEALVAWCRKGTVPTTPAPDFATTKLLLLQTVDEFERDLQAGRFTTFTSYQTSAGIELRDVAGALAFNNFHEGIHLGYCLALRRVLDT